MVARRKLSTASVLTLATAAAKLRAPLESVEQALFVKRVRLDPRTRGLLWCAVPNGGTRHPREAVNLKRQGVVAGVPDLLFFEPHGLTPQTPVTAEQLSFVAWSHCGLAIEMKRRPNKVSPEQREWLTGLEARGWSTAVCYSAEEAWTTLTDYLGIDP
jgi:hypothetical protein